MQNIAPAPWFGFSNRNRDKAALRGWMLLETVSEMLLDIWN